MKILADQNIPFAAEAFSGLGDVGLFVGRELSHEQVKQADVLLVRSVTQVNQALLDNTAVKFVGTATIGTDHIDLDYLTANKIGFASAPGSNATSASEYVLAALLYYADQFDVDLTTKTVGIVGYGNVGTRVASLLHAIGIKLKIYDPLRAEKYNDIEYCDWPTILGCNVITAHVPLTQSGTYPTFKMFNNAFFENIKPDTLFINTSRGKAVDEAALLAQLDKGKQLHLILDVWCNEPAIDKTLLQHTLLGTSHIAGYAYDGKLRGTEMICQAACEFFNVPISWSAKEALTSEVSKDAQNKIKIKSQDGFWQALNPVVRQAYTIKNDSDALRDILQMNDTQSAAHFDGLRKHYPKRREFSHYKLVGDNINTVYNQLGFIIK